MVQDANTQTQIQSEAERLAAIDAALGDLAHLANTPKPPPALSRDERRKAAHAKAVANAANLPATEKTDVVITPQGAIPITPELAAALPAAPAFEPQTDLDALVAIDDAGRMADAELARQWIKGDVVHISPALIQQHGIIAIKALRRAHVIVCEDEGLRSQIEREMRITPAHASDDLDSLAADRRAEMNGRVAVVIPSFNYARFVSQAIDSVLAQTWPADEIIVVDDASTDDTLAVLEPYLQAGKIKLLQHAVNSGTVGASRNTGIAATDAEFVLCLDADDMIAPEYVETCLAAIKDRHEIGVVYVGVKTINEANGQQMVHQGWPPPFSWKFMSTRRIPANNCIPTASLFRREMWERCGGYDEGMRSTEDVEFWIRALGCGFEAVKCDERPLFIYRRHGESMSSRPPTDVGAWNNNFNGFKPLAAPLDKDEVPPLRNYAHPAVSVVIPVGPGHQKYLRTALQSLLAQTAPDFEVIVVNDTNGPLVVPGHPYARVTHGNGHGVANARNAGVAAAHAPLIFFLDADDYLHPDTLRRVCEEYVRAGGGKYVYTGWTTVHENGDKKPYQAAPYLQTEFLKPDSKGLHGVSVLIAKANYDEVGGFDPAVPWFEDLEFFARCASKGLCGVAVQEPLLFYRVHTGDRHNISRTAGNRAQYSAMISAKYGAHLRGEINMACGSCSSPIDPLRAANHMAGSRGASGQFIGIAGPDEVLMEYCGREIKGPSGRFRGRYRGWTGMPPVPVIKADVDFMLSTTQWRIAAAPPTPVDTAHVPMSA